MTKPSEPTTDPTTTHPVAKRRTLHVIALFEAVKGFAALAAGIGLLSLVHRDVRHLAMDLIGHFGLNPGGHYPAILLHYADALQDADLRLLLLAAVAYITIRLAEAYGLWKDHAWAEWLGALSGALYIPFEIRHFLHRPSTAGAAVFVGNLFVVGFLAYQLWRRRGRE